MLSKKDPRVVEYRKAALRPYLQMLLNDSMVSENPYLIEFLKYE